MKFTTDYIKKINIDCTIIELTPEEVAKFALYWTVYKDKSNRKIVSKSQVILIR